MEDLNKIIADNLKKIREEKNYSLDELAKMTGVSKSMLGQIERGESNPSIATVWKIANGLKKPFSELIKHNQSINEIIQREEIEPFIEDNGKYKVYPFFPYEDGKKFEMYEVNIEKGGYLSAEAHINGTIEYIIVFEGEITVWVNNEEYRIEHGNSFKFQADMPHSYHNSGNSYTRLVMVLYYV